MIAELRNKISSTGSNLTERLEDNLTGNFFGSLRYIPFNLGMKSILQSLHPNELTSLIKDIDIGMWHQYIQFWPHDDEGEIDVLINLPDICIGIEVKYHSGLSSDDEINNESCLQETEVVEFRKSKQQLARESRILRKKGAGKKKLLIFVANEDMCHSVYKTTKDRNILAEDVELASLSWQDILEALKSIQSDNEYENLIIQDLKDLLIHKGFERFQRFSQEQINLVNPYASYKFKDSGFEYQWDFIIDRRLYYEFG